MWRVHDFERLEAWQLSHQLTVDAYKFTKQLPPDERFGLSQQMRRCAVSISSNIAEGAGIGGKSFVHHLRIASGSCSELQAQSYLARDLGFVGNESVEALASSASRVRRVIHGLLSSLEHR